VFFVLYYLIVIVVKCAFVLKLSTTGSVLS
jgi:hypothetical protein